MAWDETRPRVTSLSVMRPLVRVLGGFLLASLDLRYNGFDMLPDVVGWILVLSGLGSLTALGRWFLVGVVATTVVGFLSLLQQSAEPGQELRTAVAALETLVTFSTCSGILAAIGDDPARRRVDALRWTDLGFAVVLFAGSAAVGFETVETMWALPLVIVGLGILVWFLLTLFTLRDHPRLGGASVSA